jgi:hypothetical protein
VESFTLTRDLRFDRILAFAEAIELQPWKFASSMAAIPHEYVHESKWIPSPAEGDGFARAIQTIRAYGYSEQWGRKEYRYLNVNGWRYWVMPSMQEGTFLINRARIEYPVTGYDDLAPRYGQMFADPASNEENEDVLARVDLRGRVLDVGCGSGFVVPHLPLDAHYTGIDPSAAMLNEARANHPSHADRFFQSRMSDWWGSGYDRIVALFGSASYLTTDDVVRIPQMLAPGGRAFLMFYDLGYTPQTHRAEGVEHPFPKATWATGAGGETLFHKYRLIVQERAP